MAKKEKEYTIIDIKNNWVILVDDYNYMLAKDLKKTDDKGKPQFKVEGYYSTLSNALNGFLKVATTKKIISSEKVRMSLQEALEETNGIYQEYIDLLKEIVEKEV